MMMHVRDVRVFVGEALVPMGVRVRLAGWIARCMIVLVVLIVHVWVRMFRRLVNMMVLVMLAKVQPHAEAHQQPG